MQTLIRYILIEILAYTMKQNKNSYVSNPYAF